MDRIPSLYRKRYIPNETVHLKDDIILKHTNDLIITQWNTLKPRQDIKRGVSAYFLDKGIKVSKIFDACDNLVYWYCDIIHTVYDSRENSYVFHDLLVDVLVLPDGFVKVADLDELGELAGNQALSPELICQALKQTTCLLEDIYCGRFNCYTDILEAVCPIQK